MTVVDKFSAMGARCVVEDMPVSPVAISRRARLRRQGRERSVTLDVRRDRRGEYYLIRHRPDVDLEVLQVDPRDRHLVLMSRDGDVKSRFLCGHDERHWFVGAIPETARVSTVVQAKEALKPAEVAALPVRRKHRNRRRNEAWLRQGEWFFVPVDDVDDSVIHRNEIFTRGGKPHIAEELVRTGGHTVYVGFTESDLLNWGQGQVQNRVLRQEEFDALGKDDRRKGTWRVQTSGMTVYVRGAVRHPDHATLNLRGWHRVVLNTEREAQAMSHVLFLD